MYRKNNRPEPSEHINIVFARGGLGDFIASLPVYRYIQDKYGEYQNIHFYVPDFLNDFTKFVLSDCDIISPRDKRGVTGPCFHNYIKEFNGYLRMHLTDCASAQLLGTILDPCDKNYLHPDIYKLKQHKKVKKLDKYIVITTMFTSPTRVFPAKEVNKLCDWLNDRDVTPVFLGKDNVAGGIKANETDIDYSKGVNLINQTSLIEALKIMDDSKCVLGVDNGLLHLAAMLPYKPIIGGFPTVNPIHRLPYRNEVRGAFFEAIVPNIDCRFCQSNWAMDIEQTFTECFYGDSKCCDEMTAERFITELERMVL